MVLAIKPLWSSPAFLICCAVQLHNVQRCKVHKWCIWPRSNPQYLAGDSMNSDCSKTLILPRVTNIYPRRWSEGRSPKGIHKQKPPLIKWFHHSLTGWGWTRKGFHGSLVILSFRQLTVFQSQEFWSLSDPVFCHSIVTHYTVAHKVPATWETHTGHSHSRIRRPTGTFNF